MTTKKKSIAIDKAKRPRKVTKETAPPAKKEPLTLAGIRERRSPDRWTQKESEKEYIDGLDLSQSDGQEREFLTICQCLYREHGSSAETPVEYFLSELITDLGVRALDLSWVERDIEELRNNWKDLIKGARKIAQEYPLEVFGDGDAAAAEKPIAKMLLEVQDWKEQQAQHRREQVAKASAVAS
ncbi:MAG: hypothetical protein WAN65_19220 [Candidatus Sulfotelmatobacter sp.]